MTKEELEKDIITLVLRLKGEPVDTFSPEVTEVMGRWLQETDRKLFW